MVLRHRQSCSLEIPLFQQENMKAEKHEKFRFFSFMYFMISCLPVKKA